MVNFETNCESCYAAQKKLVHFYYLTTPTTSFFFVVLQITWLDGDGTVIASAEEGDDADPSVQQVTEVIENTKRVTTISTLSMTAKKSHHNTNITCQVCYTLTVYKQTTDAFCEKNVHLGQCLRQHSTF